MLAFAGVVAAEAEKAIAAGGVAAEAAAGTDLAEFTGVPAVRGGTADTDAVGAENARRDTGAVEAERRVAEVPGKEATAQITEMIALKNIAAVKMPMSATGKETKALRKM